jgi:hypothetical protein
MLGVMHVLRTEVEARDLRSPNGHPARSLESTHVFGVPFCQSESVLRSLL